ncbi:mycothiol synthase [Corynebacterium mycetoides]|uniref:Mycothiol acetyltransferase n=1 Tax=Corynebacterium mycetoides TaxID=38302 RepID=A0A1G9NZ93_9CORY|nr:mycothiol synthase [Corynebacterium mycetoides]SDL91694.1 mycothiol synthase [Corynebacterium mycetoides]
MTNRITEVKLPGDTVRGMLERVQANDGVEAFSEQFLAGLDDARLAHTHFAYRSGDGDGDGDGDGSVLGLASLAPDGSAELAVDPDHRGGGIGTALVGAVLERRDDAGLWAHGNLPAARALAAELGFVVVRELLVMSVDGDALRGAAEVPELPEGYTATNYTEATRRWGRADVERAWLKANNDAFSWHPEQGGWDEARLHAGMEAEWFDPDGVLLLYHGEELAGFHWTKVHPDGTGEVYVVGLDSGYRRKGLGDPLVRIGLAHLVRRGAQQVKLYVEADNEPAVARYEALGFHTAESHVVYQKPGATREDVKTIKS